MQRIKTNIKFSFLAIFLLLLSGVHTFSQAYKTATEVGVYGGGAYYLGDLNTSNHFSYSQPSFGLIYRYNLSTRHSIRATAFYGKVKADDATSKKVYQRNRNLSFESPILELGVGYELDLFHYRITDMKYPISPYFFYQIAYARINPTTNYNGNTVDLQPLGTEGQGTSLSNQSKYTLNQFTIPFGIGLKMNLKKGLAISLEYGIRKTFTDYLDDVSGNYVNTEQLATENGPLAAELSNRSKVFNGVVNRGNSLNKDWYSFYGVMLTFKPFKRNICQDMKGR